MSLKYFFIADATRMIESWQIIKNKYDYSSDAELQMEECCAIRVDNSNTTLAWEFSRGNLNVWGVHFLVTHRCMYRSYQTISALSCPAGVPVFLQT